MSGYPGYQYPQYQPHPQAITPWMQPAMPAPQAPALPASPEGTALAGVLGAAATGLVVEGGMFLANVSPKTAPARAALTLGTMAFGGAAAALGYRVSANRHYEAARKAVGLAGVSPGQAAGNLRFAGKLGRWGKLEVDIPEQSIINAVNLYQRVTNPHTPPLVNDYFNRAAENAANMAAAGFVQCMPDPRMFSQMPPQPQYVYAYPPPPPGQQPPPPAGN